MQHVSINDRSVACYTTSGEMALMVALRKQPPYYGGGGVGSVERHPIRDLERIENSCGIEPYLRFAHAKVDD